MKRILFIAILIFTQNIFFTQNIKDPYIVIDSSSVYPKQDTLYLGVDKIENICNLLGEAKIKTEYPSCETKK